ncbi:MAG: UvrD-helicase domain-containing protein [Deferribacterales bacterium]
MYKNSGIKPLLALESSAGSGKTYNLAKRYLQLLADNKSIDSVVAMTFTNKAAAEMKERIIVFLKRVAGIYPNDESLKDIGLSEIKAMEKLIEIFNDTNKFNVTTIDSFMNTILSAFTPDLNLYPDYDIYFDSDKIFELACLELFLDGNNKQLLKDFLQKLLEYDKDGIDPEGLIKRSLKSFKDFKLEGNVVGEWELMRNHSMGNGFTDLIYGVEKEILELSEDIKKFIKDNIDDFDKRLIQWVEKLSDIKKFDTAVVKALSSDLTERLKKNSKLDLNDVNNKWRLLAGLYTYYLVLTKYQETKETFNVVSKFINIEDELKKQLNIVDGNRLAKTVAEILNKDEGVTSAFCKLGGKIYHYLIDEFQDTSILQFESINPLIENAISEGGTLFVVGDKKQAIYAWRGGDYRVFDILDDFLNVRSQILVKENLNINFRSRREIVEFNNFIFNKNNLNTPLEKLIKDEDEKNEIIKEIEKIYNSSQQEVVDTGSGYVEVKFLDRDKESIEEDIRDRLKNDFCNDLRKIFEKGYNSSDIMILVRGKKDIPTIINWLSEEFPDRSFITEDSLSLMQNFDIKKLLLIASYILDENDEALKKAVEEVGLSDLIDEDIKKCARELPPYQFFIKVVSKLNLDKNCIKYVNSFLEEVNKLNFRDKSLREIVEYFYDNREISININENIDAIKIMTIHKSKGLESDVVLIPFTDWVIGRDSSELYDYVKLDELNIPEKTIFCKIDEKLAYLLEDAAVKKVEKKKRAVIEAINLLYVAFTRPKEALFVYYYKAKNVNTVGDMLSYILKDSSEDSVTKGNQVELIKFCKGVFDNLKGKASTSIVSEGVAVHDFILNHDFKDLLNIVDNRYESLHLKEQLTGELFHLVMSRIGRYDSQNIEEIYYETIKDFGFDNKEIIPMVENTLQDLKVYYEVDEYWNEKEFLKNGFIFRVDRLVKKDGRFIVIDFKTGDKNDKDLTQVRQYLSLLPAGSKGLIYYVKDREMIYVD